MHNQGAHSVGFAEDCVCSICATWLWENDRVNEQRPVKQQQEHENGVSTGRPQGVADQSNIAHVQTSHPSAGNAHQLHTQAAPTGTAGFPQQPAIVGQTVDAGLSEANLPEYMGRIEAGTFNPDNSEWSFVTRKKQPFKVDHYGRVVVGAYSGKQLRGISFLPDRVPEKVAAWKVNYWLRKAVHDGIYVSMEDVNDRIVPAPRVATTPPFQNNGTTATSMWVQRYIQGLGQLSLVEKKKTGIPAEQAMETIEQLSVIQGKLNTWWLLMNMTMRGPWTAVEPRTHPGYKEQLSTYQGHSYVIEHSFGLSDRMRKISDGMIFLDVLAEEAGYGHGALGRKRIAQAMHLPKEEAKEEIEKLETDFKLFQAGGEKPWLTIDYINRALQNAVTEPEIFSILAGDISAMNISANATPPTGVPSLWSLMTNERVIYLLAIGKASNDKQDLADGQDSENEDDDQIEAAQTSGVATSEEPMAGDSTEDWEQLDGQESHGSPFFESTNEILGSKRAGEEVADRSEAMFLQDPSLSAAVAGDADTILAAL